MSRKAFIIGAGTIATPKTMENIRSFLVQLILASLILNFFFEGIYKIAYFSTYATWLHYAPILAPAAPVLKYLIPAVEILLSVALLIERLQPVVLWIIIVLLLGFIFWIMSVYFFTDRLFWPYKALWKNPTWMQKMTISVAICWTAFIARICLSKKHKSESAKPHK